MRAVSGRSPQYVFKLSLLVVFFGSISFSEPGPPSSRAQTKLEDLVVVFGTSAQDDRNSLVRATRLWRKGIRAVIVQNEKPTPQLDRSAAKHSELYLYYPDRDNSESFHSQYPGDVRLALAPFLAAKNLNPDTYKWLLVGDDDTFWFLEGVLKLANDLDHTIPYIITDESYWHNWGRPHAPRFLEDGPPRCLPCNFHPGARTEDVDALFTPPIGCPCRPQLLCDADGRGIMDDACNFPGNMDNVFADLIYSIDGGSGALLSAGLMQALDLNEVEDCITNTNGSASDHIFTFCMWKLGYAITAPSIRAMPTNHPSERLFNPGDRDPTRHEGRARFDLMTQLLWAVEGNPSCSEFCQHQLLKIVTCHLKSRGLRHLQAAAGIIQALSELYNAFLVVMGQMVQHVNAAPQDKNNELLSSES